MVETQTEADAWLCWWLFSSTDVNPSFAFGADYPRILLGAHYRHRAALPALSSSTVVLLHWTPDVDRVDWWRSRIKMTFVTCLRDPGKTWMFGSLTMYKDKIPKLQHVFQDSNGRRTAFFIKLLSSCVAWTLESWKVWRKGSYLGRTVSQNMLFDMYLLPQWLVHRASWVCVASRLSCFSIKTEGQSFHEWTQSGPVFSMMVSFIRLAVMSLRSYSSGSGHLPSSF